MWVSPGVNPPSDPDEDDRMPAFAAGTIPDDTPTGTISGLSSPQEPYVMTEVCSDFQSYHYRSWDDGGIDASQHYYTTSTDCEGNGDFLISEDELADAYQPMLGVYEFFLQVSSAWGTGENDFDIWAGPSPRDQAEGAAPANGNARHIYIVNKRDRDIDTVHYAHGVAIYAVGHMPMNMIAADREDIPIAYMGPETTGQQMTVQLWDADTQTEPPIYFYFDSVPVSDWNACFESTNPAYQDCDDVLGSDAVISDDPANIPRSDGWSTWTFTIPSIEEEPYVNFPGGRLIANYNGGHTDNFTWNISLESRPFLVE
jgi:hypothetical protein